MPSGISTAFPAGAGRTPRRRRGIPGPSHTADGYRTGTRHSGHRPGTCAARPGPLDRGRSPRLHARPLHRRFRVGNPWEVLRVGPRSHRLSRSRRFGRRSRRAPRRERRVLRRRGPVSESAQSTTPLFDPQTAHLPGHRLALVERSLYLCAPDSDKRAFTAPFGDGTRCRFPGPYRRTAQRSQ